METTKLCKFTVTYPNRNEFHTLKREIWGQDCYSFETKDNLPTIIDIGSHIGISVLYFKAIYPDSKIFAFEPNPRNIEILRENILLNGLQNIDIIPKAVCNENGTKPFYIDSSNSNWDSNSSLIEGSWNSKEKTEKITVECTKLDTYLENAKVNCLKIDTEGSELDIVKSIKRYLDNIENLFIEYHPRKGKSIKEILSILTNQFDIEIYSEGKRLKKEIDGKLILIKGVNKNY